MKLGTPGVIVGFDIDTSHFNGTCGPNVDYLLMPCFSCHATGNEAPQASVQALFSLTGQDPANDDDRVSQSFPVLLGLISSSGSKSCLKSTLGPTLVTSSPFPVPKRRLVMSSSTCTPMAAL